MNKQEKPEQALKINQTVFPSDHWQILGALGEAYPVAGDRKHAEYYYRKSIELNPMSFPAYKFLHGN